MLVDGMHIDSTYQKGSELLLLGKLQRTIIGKRSAISMVNIILFSVSAYFRYIGIVEGQVLFAAIPLLIHAFSCCFYNAYMLKKQGQLSLMILEKTIQAQSTLVASSSVGEQNLSKLKGVYKRFKKLMPIMLLNLTIGGIVLVSISISALATMNQPHGFMLGSLFILFGNIIFIIPGYLLINHLFCYWSKH